jgi:integrase
MRPEETIALRWSDIDWNRQVARVRRVRTFKGAERDGSKTHAERDVDLVPQALEALLILKPYTYPLKIDRGTDADTTADIFQNPVTRRAWHDERSQRDHYWRPSLKRLGIRWRKPYNTRHTFATAALMAAVPPAYIAAQLGHSIKTLLEKYARWIPGNDQGKRPRHAHRRHGANAEFVPNSSQKSNGPT